MKTYSYDVDVVCSEYSASQTIDDVARFDTDGGMWMTFYAVNGETLAVFAVHAVVAVVKDMDSVKETAA